MRKIIAFLVSFFFPTLMIAQGVWTQKPSIGNSDYVERTHLAGFELNGEGYIAGGLAPGRQTFRNSLNDVYRYSVSGDSWSRVADCGVSGRAGAMAFSVNGKGYFGLGYIQVNSSTQVYLRDVWEFDPITNAWTQKADLRSSGRHSAHCFVIGNFAYAGGGNSNNTPLIRFDFWRYNPVTNVWNQLANIGSTQARYGASAFSIGGKGYIACGYKSALNGPGNDLLEYDTTTNLWTAKASLPVAGAARINAVGFALNGKGYIAGGNNNGPTAYYNDCFEYDNVTNTWVQKANATATFTFSASFAINNEGYVKTGNRDGNIVDNTLMKFNPVSNSWTYLTPPLATARTRFCATTINGKIFIGPGVTGDYSYSNIATFFSVFRRDSWLYDPTNESWTKKDSFPNIRYGASNFTIDSLVYVVGGSNNANVPTTECWSYNPNGNGWTQRANFTGPARMGGIGQTINNRGYYGLGVTQATGVYQTDWYEYVASSNTWVLRASPPVGYLGRFFGGSFEINGKGYVMAGSQASPSPAQCYEYDPLSNAWTAKTSVVGSTLVAGAAFAIGNKGYYACGYNQTGYLDTAAFKKQLYEFDPVANTWTQKATLPFSSGREGCVGVGLNGYGYVCGGLQVSQAANGTDEVFTYKSDLWQFTPDSIVPTIASGATGFCAGSSFTVNYRTVALTLGAGNVFTVQLSNASGSFTSPINIGTLTSTATSGSITATIPAGQSAGTGYRIRITSSNFVDIGDPLPVNLTVSNSPLTTSSFTPTNGLPGDSITLTGTNYIGTSEVRFNGTITGFRVISATQLRAKVPLFATTGKISVTTPCATILSAANFTVNTFNFTCKMFVEGLYTGNGTMTPTLYQTLGGADTMATDTVYFKIHSQGTPYTVFHSGTGILKKNGLCTLTIPGGYYNSLFYLEVKTRNSIETWSKVPVMLNNLVPLDFTD